MYKLYIDKSEDFICELQVKNASLKNSIARLIIESNEGPNLIFSGKINGDKCIIPIKRLKGILDENTHGKMHLELIVEDTYFRPWESDFTVEEHTSVKVKVNEQIQSSKPSIKLKTHPTLSYTKENLSNRKGINVFVPKKEIAMLCEHFGIGKRNLHKKQKEFVQILKEYFKSNPEYNCHARKILRGITSFLK